MNCNRLKFKCKSQQALYFTISDNHCNRLKFKCKSQPGHWCSFLNAHCNRLKFKCKSQLSDIAPPKDIYCNRLKFKCKSQHSLWNFQLYTMTIPKHKIYAIKNPVCTMQRLGFLLRKFFYLQCNRLKPNANHN